MGNAVELQEARYGSVAGYKDYVKNTGLIFPWDK